MYVCMYSVLCITKLNRTLSHEHSLFYGIGLHILLRTRFVPSTPFCKHQIQQLNCTRDWNFISKCSFGPIKVNCDSSIVTVTGYKKTHTHTHKHCTAGIRIPARVGTLFSLPYPTTQPALRHVSEAFGARRQPVNFTQCRRKARVQQVPICLHQWKHSEFPTVKRAGLTRLWHSSQITKRSLKRRAGCICSTALAPKPLLKNLVKFDTRHFTENYRAILIFSPTRSRWTTLTYGDKPA